MMKKILVSTAFLVVIGVGGVFAYNQTEEQEQTREETVEEVKTQETQQATTVKEEEVEKPSTENVPTERTVDIGSNKPWEIMFTKEIFGKQNDGEIVYLLSDAEELENVILSFSQGAFEELNDKSKNTFGNSKDKMAISWADHIKAFTAGVSKDYDNPAYFNQLHQVQLALEANDYESIPELINEAKTLR